jgi:ATP-dependent exoDNAse (exonuclease V) beta subunit
MSALLRGTIVHQLLERVDRSPTVDEVAEVIRGHDAEVTEAEVERVRGLVERFLSSPLRERAAAGRARRELPFAFELRPDREDPRSILVNGVIDLHVEEPDGVLVVDYKTGLLEGVDPAAAGAVAEAIVAERYATQRLVYALAVLRSGAPRVDVAYSFLEAADQPVETTFTADQADELEGQLLDLARGVLEGSFAPTDAPHRELCLTCPGRASLCSWGPEHTLREHPRAAIPS